MLNECLDVFYILVVLAQVGSALLLDSSAAEQQCASCVLGVAVDRDGACCGVQYLKQGLLAAADLAAAIDVSTVWMRIVLFCILAVCAIPCPKMLCIFAACCSFTTYPL